MSPTPSKKNQENANKTPIFFFFLMKEDIETKSNPESIMCRCWKNGCHGDESKALWSIFKPPDKI